ncbi:catechol 2,3-dioxygenase [Gracilibacillus ureilyticus]|uniref:Catechol 2,3-dioxygenase n=1 Tax=Gracilibacillus ureilyticus TaxID=531814 RepID=A0A1H9TA00_9BACI|nr:VOC family protein [Gracilibacillus ureilyticus]SER93453.1 catechol 2,3-dioxygenase [Gracilibacillus ureilyticus]
MNFHRKPITFVSQVNLKVKNIKRSVKFYKEIIGLKVLEETERKAQLSADGKKVLLSIEQPSDVITKQNRTVGLFHFALLLPNRSDLGEFLKHILQVEYPLQGGADHLVSEALYLSDPDGNGIEIYCDRNPSEWVWKRNEVVMPSEELDVNDLLENIEGKEWSGLPVGTIVGHIHLHVSELKKNQEFYIKGLGFEVVSRYDNHAIFMSEGKYHHHVALNIWNGIGAPQPPINSVGLESFSLMIASEEKRNKIVTQLKNIGAFVKEEHGSIITADPSGNRIRLII